MTWFFILLEVQYAPTHAKAKERYVYDGNARSRLAFQTWNFKHGYYKHTTCCCMCMTASPFEEACVGAVRYRAVTSEQRRGWLTLSLTVIRGLKRRLNFDGRPSRRSSQVLVPADRPTGKLRMQILFTPHTRTNYRTPACCVGLTSPNGAIRDVRQLASSGCCYLLACVGTTESQGRFRPSPTILSNSPTILSQYI
jgi:hypothetical protein